MPNQTPEEKAREKIDSMLTSGGWIIQDYKELNLGTSYGVAVREFPLTTGAADYVLFIDRMAAGVIEAKPKGTTLSGVAEQSEKYVYGVPAGLPHIHDPLPFVYESTGVETFFRDLRDPDPCSRRVFTFHKPETLMELGSQEDTLRARLKNLPTLVTEGLWDCQIEAIQNLEESFSGARPRALLQMATGSGKTFAAVSSIYRLIKFGKAKRVLFLVDRKNLGRQAFREFQQYVTPDDGRKFTELYNVQHLTTNALDPVSRVCITTIQRLFSMLKGEKEFDDDLEEKSMFDTEPDEQKPMEVIYNPDIPMEFFDFIITDECHRSIYNIWRQVLEYFDAFLIGLTATPSKQTIGFFYNNMVMEYSHERAVADGVNVNYDVYRIKTKISEKGSTVESGYYVDKRDRLTRQQKCELLDEDLVYQGTQLDRDVVAPDQIRTIVRTFRDKVLTEIFPGRTEVPKTLFFSKNDSHAEDIVHIIREEFGKGNDFCKKITYRTTGDKPENILARFRNSYNPRIAVTVDMVATGTDIKAIECLVFMRDVKSGVYFEQMKGRGTRVIDPTELIAVTPDAGIKTHFVIVDAVGVCEGDKTDSRPLERKKTIPFDKLLGQIALGIRDDDRISSLAGRLSRLNRILTKDQEKEIVEISRGKALKELVNGLMDSVNPDTRMAKAMERYETDLPTPEQLMDVKLELVDDACSPFDKPELRNTLVDIQKQSTQTIDVVSEDILLFAGPDKMAREKALSKVDSFREFLEENRDELTALQIIYNKPYGQRHLTYEQIRELARAIEKPPYMLTPELLWQAYQKLEQNKVRGAGPQVLLTNLISLVRFAMGESEILAPFPETVDERFDSWIVRQEGSGRKFTSEQMEWLESIKEHIATSLRMEMDDFENVPFNQKGGAMKAFRLFGDDLAVILDGLNEELAG